MKITKRQLRRIIREEKANILRENTDPRDKVAAEVRRTARSFTLKGIQGLINNAERNLSEIEELDAELGDLGRDARAASREMILDKLQRYQEAYYLRIEMGGE